MRILFGIALISCLAQATIAQTTKQSDSAPETQAVCKDQKIPADRVVVGVYASDACTPPGTENSWDTAIPEDGTIACEKPSYESAAAVLRFETCETVITNKCPANLDGTQNAFVLRSPSSCLKAKQLNLKLRCTGTVPLNPQFAIAKGETELAADEFVVGITDTDVCKDAKFPAFAQNAFIIQRRLNPYETFQFCTEGGGKQLDWNDVILRRFYNEFCPKNVRNSAVYLNAIVVVKLSASPKPGQVFCVGTPLIYEADSFGYSKPPDHTYYDVWDSGDDDQVSDPLCGNDGRPYNGIKINRSKTWAARGHKNNDCESGVFQEQNPILVWNLTFNKDDLTGQRTDGQCSLHLTRTGETWSGFGTCGEQRLDLVMRPNDGCTQLTSNLATFCPILNRK